MLGRTTTHLVAAVMAAALWTGTGAAEARDVRVSEATRFYAISGRTPADFAAAMSRNGPFSGQHRRRVWATASRTMRYRLDRRRQGGRCRVTRAEVTLKIDYTMPRLRGRVAGAARTKWNRMYKILNRHERVHGRYYKDLAKQTQAALARIKPQRSCASLDTVAARIVQRLSRKNQALNDRFDRNDRRNYRRMERLYAARRPSS